MVLTCILQCKYSKSKYLVSVIFFSEYGEYGENSMLGNLKNQHLNWKEN